jgi:hypothetical protein
MPLTKNQIKAASLLVEGETRKKTAKQCGVAESTIYNWQRLPEFQNEMQKQGLSLVKIRLPILLDNMMDLALHDRSGMVRFNATKDLLDRIGLSEEVMREVEEDEKQVFVTIVKGEPKKYEPKQSEDST